MMQQLNEQEIATVRKLYTTPSQHGAARGLRQFYHTMLQEGKIGPGIGWAAFRLAFQDWDPWVKFVQDKKSTPRLWQHYTSYNIDAELVVDVALMSKQYKSYAGFLVAVNACTRYVSAEPIKNRKKEELIKALNTIMQKTGIIPNFIYTDKEPSLGSAAFKQFAKDKHIEVVYTKSLYKAALAEQEIKYIKQSLKKYVDQDQTNNWPQYLPAVIENQNNTYSKAAGGIPSQINVNNVWWYVSKRTKPIHDFAEWYHKQEGARARLQTRPSKTLKAKDGYFYVGQPVHINLSSVQLLHDSRDSSVKRSKTG